MLKVGTMEANSVNFLPTRRNFSLVSTLTLAKYSSLWASTFTNINKIMYSGNYLMPTNYKISKAQTNDGRQVKALPLHRYQRL